MDTLVLNGLTVFDGTPHPSPEATTIVIRDGRIDTVGKTAALAASIPAPAETLALDGKFALPGLVDAHVHACSYEHPTPLPPLTRGSEAALAVSGAKNARRALLNGVTTMRDLGAKGGANLKLRDMVANGYLPGPRILASGTALAMTGGHGAGDISIEVDGPAEIVKAVRQLRKMGADCIKLMANGLSVNSPELTADEMRAAVDTAHAAGLRVAAHASVWSAVENALAAGVDTLEHGYTLNEALIEKMLAQGTILVPTFGTVSQVARIGDQFDFWRDRMDAIRARMETALAGFSLAWKMGVPFAIGTDGSNWPLLRVGEVLTEMRSLQAVGLGNFDLLLAGTRGSARALGLEDQIGALAPGRQADLVILNRNPLEDLEALQDVALVIQAGKIVVRDGRILAE